MNLSSQLASVSSLFFLFGCAFSPDPGNHSMKQEDSTKEKESLFESLFHARVIEWAYPADINRKQAEQVAARLKSCGITHVLTEDHRYILYDLKDPDNPPDFLFPPQPKEKSIAATKLVTDVLRSHGIYCLHHVTSTYATKDFMEQHRDWTQRDARNPEVPLFFEEYGGVYLFCLNNPGFREEFFRTVLDITRRTNVDGWMIDEVEWLPTWHSCGCEHCRKKFYEETGYKLPTDPNSPVWEDFENPLWRAWLRWRMKTSGDFFVDLNARLDAAIPGKIITACHAGASDTWLAQKWGMDILELRRGLNWIFYEAYIREGIPFYSWKRHLAELRLYKAIARPTGLPPLALFYTRSENELIFAWALCSLSGSRFWAEFDFKDKNFLDFFKWQKEHEFLFGKQKQIANIALLFSKQTRDGFGGFDTEHYVDEWGGWAETLNQDNIPHQAIIDSDLEYDFLSRFELVIVPHAVCMSNDQISALLDFRAKGGKLIITGDTALRDETGSLRKDAKLIQMLRSESFYIPEKLGLKTELNYFRIGEKREHSCDENVKKRMIASVENLVGENIPYRLEAPRGVIINAFRLQDASMVFHLLNATGANLPLKTELLGKDYPVELPVVYDIVLTMPKTDTLPLYKKTTCYSYSSGKKQNLPLAFEGGEYRIKLPKLEIYSVIHLTKD